MECCRDGCPSGRFFHLHRGTLELSQSDHRVLGHIPDQGPSPPIAQFGQAASSRKSLGGSKLLPFKNGICLSLLGYDATSLYLGDTPVFGEFLPFFSADPLKFCQVEFGALLHSYFQASLFGPFQGWTTQAQAHSPFRCLLANSKWAVVCFLLRIGFRLVTLP